MPDSLPQSAFTTIRLMGEKAQKILREARGLRQERGGRGRKGSPPPRRTRDELCIHVSVGNVLQAAFTILAVVLGTWLVIHVKDKLILLLLAIFLAAIIDPGVQALERLRIPRGIAILLHYFFALFVLLFLLSSLIPILASQLQQIALFISWEVDKFLANPEISLPLLSSSLNERLTNLAQATLQNLSINEFADALQNLGQNLSAAAQGSLRFATRIAGGVVAFFIQLIIVLVLAFFLEFERENVINWFRGFLPQESRSYLDSKSEAIHSKIAQWARGQLLLAFSIACLVFIALEILRMPYALTLAVLAGFTEFIPYIGPFIAAIPAVLIALTQEGLIFTLIIAAVYYVIQWCENNLLVPLIMKRAVGLSPIAIIFAMLIGVSFPSIIHPVIGILLAVPVTTILTLFLEDWREMRGKR